MDGAERTVVVIVEYEWDVHRVWGVARDVTHARQMLRDSFGKRPISRGGSSYRVGSMFFDLEPHVIGRPGG